MPNPLCRRTLLLATLATAACGKPASDLAVGDDCQVAREADRRGDYKTARTAFASCLARVPGYVDSHASYQRILELEDGIEAARKVYADLVRDNPGVVTSFAHARLLPSAERTVALERIAAQQPDFAPVYYELAFDVSERALGLQSLAAKAKEKLYLQAFLQRAHGPEFVRYFADYAFAEAWIRDAQARMAKLADVAIVGDEPPLTMTATPSNAGWMIHFTPRELAKAIEVRVGGEADFRRFEQYITVPLSASSTRIEVRYQDATGAWQGPFDFTLEPKAQFVTFAKSVLLKMPSIWAMLGEDSQAGYLYFTTAMVYRCGLSRIEYGLDTDVPDREFALPACDFEDPMAIPATALPMVEIDPRTAFVSLRLTFADGERTDVHRIARKR